MKPKHNIDLMTLAPCPPLVLGQLRQMIYEDFKRSDPPDYWPIRASDPEWLKFLNRTCNEVIDGERVDLAGQVVALMQRLRRGID